MAPTEEQLVAGHHYAVQMLERKLSKIEDRVFHSGRKPTISDFYSNNTEAIYVPDIPKDLQLPFVFTNYQQFVDAGFRVDKKNGDMNINLAIFYWQMDDSHSFSHKHRQMRHNILMACIVCASHNPLDYVTKEAHEFACALIDAWVYSVTRQDGTEMQSYFLNIWANGPYDLMHFGSKAHTKMTKATMALKQYGPKLDAMGGVPFWEGLKYTSPNKVKTFGSAWAMRYIVETQKMAEDIDAKEKEIVVEDALATGSFMAGFGNMGLQQAPSGLSEELFAQPLVQSLLSDFDENMDAPSKVIPDRKDMWMDPNEAIAMLEGTSAKYESLSNLFSKVDWHMQ